MCGFVQPQGQKGEIWTGHEFGQKREHFVCCCMFLVTLWLGAMSFFALGPVYVCAHLDVLLDIGVGATGVTFLSMFFLAMGAAPELSVTFGMKS